MERSFLELAALFFFSMASAGFIYCIVKFPMGSLARLWGIRACLVCGFLGVGLLRLYVGYFTDNHLLIISSLVVSLIASEISGRLLQRPS